MRTEGSGEDEKEGFQRPSRVTVFVSESSRIHEGWWDQWVECRVWLSRLFCYSNVDSTLALISSHLISSHLISSHLISSHLISSHPGKHHVHVALFLLPRAPNSPDDCAPFLIFVRRMLLERDPPFLSSFQCPTLRCRSKSCFPWFQGTPTTTEAWVGRHLSGSTFLRIVLVFHTPLLSPTMISSVFLLIPRQTPLHNESMLPRAPFACFILQ